MLTSSCIADKIKSIHKMKAYENKLPLIIFLPALSLSSSPKLNFFIKIPEPTATAAAGVEILKSQLSIVSKALVIVFTSFGYAPKLNVQKQNGTRTSVH